MKSDERVRSGKIRELRARIDEINRRHASATKKARPISEIGEGRPGQLMHQQFAVKNDGDARIAATGDGISSSPLVRRYMRMVPPRCDDQRGANETSRAVLLEQLPQGVASMHDRGAFFCITTRVASLAGAEKVDRRFQEAIACSESGLHQRFRARCQRKCAPDKLLFMDIETCGLGNAPVFLIGVMLWAQNGFEVRQYLARNYAEEAAVIGMFADMCSQRPFLITFNGKSFDYPFIRNRAIANGMNLDFEPLHFDMLHECRRIWRGHFADCKLQTLELHICQRTRSGDIPGALIPEAYHGFVRTGDARQIREICKHNLLDLITLADIMSRFPPFEPDSVHRHRYSSSRGRGSKT
jgi:uncharacterized protein YprB with RNaseH-like and TPR domain